MFTAKKFAAVCLRLFILYLAILFVETAFIFQMPAGNSAMFLVGGIAALFLLILAVLLFIFAIPLAGFIARGIDES